MLFIRLKSNWNYIVVLNSAEVTSPFETFNHSAVKAILRTYVIFSKQRSKGVRHKTFAYYLGTDLSNMSINPKAVLHVYVTRMTLTVLNPSLM